MFCMMIDTDPKVYVVASPSQYLKVKVTDRRRPLVTIGTDRYNIRNRPVAIGTDLYQCHWAMLVINGRSRNARYIERHIIPKEGLKLTMFVNIEF